MSDIAKNRRALREYQITDKYEAGIALKGTEVKSIRQGKINIKDSFARVENGQAFLYGCDIQPYECASHEQHDAKRTRKLLLHKKEIQKLWQQSQIKGNTLITLRCYWKNKRVKVEIGVGKGKAASDKREDLKKRTEKREADREIARFNRR